MTEILSLLAAAVVAVLIFTRIGLGSVLGYLAAGAAIGPHGFGLVTDAEKLLHIGEFGVVFLLFMIGLEMKPQRLWVMRRLVFGLGSLQLFGTALAIGALLLAFFDFPRETVLVVAFGLALSSTAFGVQLLSERGDFTSHYGRNSFSILLLQDLAVVPLLVLVPLLALGDSTVSSSMGQAVVEGAAILIGVLILGRFAVGPILHAIAKIGNSDTFVALTLLLVLGFSWIMGEVGLSLAMGAFIAGVLLADSEYRHQIESDILPFRGLLLGLFFMSVGMSLDPDSVTSNASLVIGGTVVLLFLKATVVILVSLLLKNPLDVSIRSGFLLSQSGEFGFVIFSLALGHQLLDRQLADALIAVIVLSMTATPFMTWIGGRLANKFHKDQTDVLVHDETEDERLVIIAGFGRVGETVAKMLVAADVPYVAIDANAEQVANARKKGYSVYFGNASRPDVLHSVGASKAKLLVITLDDAHVAEGLVRATRRHFPDLPIHVRARDWDSVDTFVALGVEHALPETVEASLRLGATALEAVGVEEEKRRALFEDLTDGNFTKMRN